LIAYCSPGIVRRISSSSQWTMGCRSGIALRIHRSISAWLSSGSGGLRVLVDFRDFGMVRPSIEVQFWRTTR
jgi:hypothetical protein